MNGLLSQQEQAAPEQAQQQGAKNNASGQEAYDMAAGQMLKWVSSDEGYAATVQALSGDPLQGMSSLIGRLLQMTNQSAYFAGKSLSPNVLFQAGMEITKALTSIGLKEGLLNEQNEAEIGEEAFFNGLAMFAQESQEEALTKESKQQFIKLIDAVEQMKNKAQGVQQA